MPVRKRAVKTVKRFDLPVSYRVLNPNAMPDARNIFSNKGINETRYGVRGYNAVSGGGPILSLSYFKTAAGVRYKLGKIGTVLYSISATGALTSIKSGLSATTKHRGVNFNDRHIICIEGDGMFSFNGTTFTQLGQAPPTTASAAVSSGGSLTDATIYQVGLTFYASSIGFETNVFALNQVTTASPNKQIDITAIPTTALNGLIDKVRIYVKNVTTGTAYLFVAEQSLSIATYTITTIPTSTQIPPTTHAAPISGGGKYPALFGKKFAYAGNSTYPTEVFLSEEYLPDAFNDTSSQVVIQTPGQGAITAIAVGFFNDTLLTPYLAIFKKTSISIYSELNGVAALGTLDAHVGCVSHETVRIRNGNIYFLSEKGWQVIIDGSLMEDKDGRQISLGNGEIDDIFSRRGWSYEINGAQSSSFFSAYYSTDDILINFVAEGANTILNKAYAYEYSIKGFRTWEFKAGFTCAIEGEDDSGYQVIFLGDSTGKLFTYSNRNVRTDQDYLGADKTIPAFALLPYFDEDMSTSYNFRDLVVRALSSDNSITVKAFASFSLQSSDSFSFAFPNSSLGFVLDVSQLDIDVLGDERVPVSATADINHTGETLLLGFYQDIAAANIALISAQLSVNKNGNRNN